MILQTYGVQVGMLRLVNVCSLQSWTQLQHVPESTRVLSWKPRVPIVRGSMFRLKVLSTGAWIWTFLVRHDVHIAHEAC